MIFVGSPLFFFGNLWEPLTNESECIRASVGLHLVRAMFIGTASLNCSGWGMTTKLLYFSDVDWYWLRSRVPTSQIKSAAEGHHLKIVCIYIDYIYIDSVIHRSVNFQNSRK